MPSSVLLSINHFSRSQSGSSTEDAKMNMTWLHIPLTEKGIGTNGYYNPVYGGKGGHEGVSTEEGALSPH